MEFRNLFGPQDFWNIDVKHVAKKRERNVSDDDVRQCGYTFVWIGCVCSTNGGERIFLSLVTYVCVFSCTWYPVKDFSTKYLYTMLSTKKGVGMYALQLAVYLLTLIPEYRQSIINDYNNITIMRPITGNQSKQAYRKFQAFEEVQHARSTTYLYLMY